MPYTFKTEPFDHQRREIEATWDLESWACFWEMGCGKSFVAIHTAARLYEAGRIDALCVVAPKGVYRNWQGEIDDHLPDEIARTVAVWSPEVTQSKTAEIRRVMAPADRLRVFLVNVEALSSKRGADVLRKFLASSRALLVVDESTSVKSHKAKRTEALVAASKLAPYRRILTGSPIENHPLDLFSQCTVLGAGLLGFTSFYAFRNRYALTETIKVHVPPKKPGEPMKTRKVEKVSGYQRLDELREKLKTFSSRVLKADCLDLPEKLYERREVALTREQESVYSELLAESRAELAGAGRVTAPMVITRLLRLHQVVCGFVRNDAGEDCPLPSLRGQALLDLAEETSGKVIVWAPFRHSISMLADLLGERFGSHSRVTYFGDTTSDDRVDAVHRFQDDPECRFFVGNPQTAGYGLTLTAASLVVYYANSHRLADRLQSEDRAHRIGQRSAVTYVDLVAPGTVDEKIVRSLRAKRQVASDVMGEEWKDWI